MIFYVSNFGHLLFWCRSSFHTWINCLYLSSRIWLLILSLLCESHTLRFGRSTVYLLIICSTRPAQVHCLNISLNITLRAVWLKSNIVYATEMGLSKFLTYRCQMVAGLKVNVFGFPYNPYQGYVRGQEYTQLACKSRAMTVDDCLLWYPLQTHILHIVFSKAAFLFPFICYPTIVWSCLILFDPCFIQSYKIGLLSFNERQIRRWRILPSNYFEIKSLAKTSSLLCLVQIQRQNRCMRHQFCCFF